MENLKEVDWSKAPEGATHYNAKCESPWLKDTPISYFNGDGWIEYRASSNKFAMKHIRNAVKRPQECDMKSKEWDGSGLPPINTVCEYLWVEGVEWRKCEVVAYYFANVVAIDVLHSSAVLLHSGLFRPIKTPEQIAREERLNAIDEMNDLILGWGVEKKMLAVLYDAGYRKTEVKK